MRKNQCIYIYLGKSAWIFLLCYKCFYLHVYIWRSAFVHKIFVALPRRSHYHVFLMLYPDVKIWLIGKDPDAGKDWRQEEKGTPEGKMVRWHHWLDGHDFEQAPGVGDRQGSLACYSPWGCKEVDTIEQLNWMLHQNIWDMGYWGEEKWPPPKDFASFSGKMACSFSLYTGLFYHVRQKYNLIIVFTWIFWCSLRRYVWAPRWQGMDLWWLIL